MTTLFAPHFTKSKLTTTLLLCTSLAMTQALIGCTRNDDKKANKKTDTAAQAEGKTAPLDCTSPAAMTGIQQYITKQIAQQANSTVQQLGQQAGINVANVSMDSLLAQMMVNVQNLKAVSGQADQCQGKVAVTIPANDITNANQMAASLNQPTLAQRLAGKGLALDNNTIVAENATFKLPNNGGSYQVNSPSADSIISEVSNVMASSQLKQMMIQNAPTGKSNASSSTNSTTTTTTTTTSTTAANNNTAVATGAGVAGAAGAAAIVHHHVKKHTTSHAAATHHDTAKKEGTSKKPDTKVTTKSSDSKTSTAKTTTHKTSGETASTKTLTDHSSKTVITKTSTEKSSMPAPKVTPKVTKVTTTTTEKTVTKPQAVPNDSTKLTIEQRNEKY